MTRYWCRYTLLFLTGLAAAQTPIPQPIGAYYGGLVLSDNFRRGSFYAPSGVHTELERLEMSVDVASGGVYMQKDTQTNCVLGTSSTCYGDIHLLTGTGHGLLNADYRRVEHNGDGPSIARKTAVRGADAQWAVWAHQINLGPGAKAALWIGGDNPEIQGRGVDTVPNVIVINSNLKVTGAVIQRNAPLGSSAAVLRVFNGPNAIVAELLENGTLRVKRIELLP